MKSRFRQDLQYLNHFVLDEKFRAQKKLDGKSKKIYFGNVFGVTFERKEKDEKFVSLPTASVVNAVIATNSSRSIKISSFASHLLISEKIKAAKRSLFLLRENKISSPFIHNYFYCSSRGEIISALAEKGDLFNYLEKNIRLSKELVRELVGQLVLAVSELHSKNLVHKDIKPENILVFLTASGQLHLRLADLDEVEQHDKISLHITGTQGFFPPEVFLTEKDFQNQENILPNQSLYIQSNKKAVDCYALGYVLNIIYFEMDNPDSELAPLIESLLNNNPAKRATIEKTKENIYFGKTREERDEFFNKLLLTYGDNMFYLDHYYPQRYPLENDAFYLLPEKIKTIYRFVEIMINQYSFLLETEKLDSYSVEAARKTTTRLIDSVEDASKDKSLQEYLPGITAVKEDANQVLDGIKNLSHLTLFKEGKDEKKSVSENLSSVSLTHAPLHS